MRQYRSKRQRVAALYGKPAGQVVLELQKTLRLDQIRAVIRQDLGEDVSEAALTRWAREHHGGTGRRGNTGRRKAEDGRRKAEARR